MKTKVDITFAGIKPSDDDRKLIEKGVNYYANKLLSRQLIPNISLIVKLKSKMRKDFEGDCEIIGYGRNAAPRHFIIRAIYKKNGGIGITLSTLAHEMVHVKQFAKKELDPMLTKWNGVKVPKGENYWDHPWEIEAFGRQQGLYTRFAKREKLTTKRLIGKK